MGYFLYGFSKVRILPDGKWRTGGTNAMRAGVPIGPLTGHLIVQRLMGVMVPPYA
jgi:hypothetical protein